MKVNVRIRLSGMESQIGVGENRLSKSQIELGLSCKSSFF